MKIKSVKISNILSFPFIEDIEAADETIVFDLNTNILIGPNGAGKSNMIEILSKLMQSYFFTSYEFLDQNFGSINANGENEKPIRSTSGDKKHRQDSLNALVKHRNYRDKESKLVLGLHFDKDDISILNFVLLKLQELEELRMDYTYESNLFDPLVSKMISFKEEFDVTFSFRIHNEIQNQVSIQFYDEKINDSQKFVHTYLQKFNLIQQLIQIALTTGRGQELKILKNFYALIGSMRQYGDFFSAMPIGVGLGGQINGQYLNSLKYSTKTQAPVDPIFEIIFMRLGQHVRVLRNGTPAKNIAECIEELLTNPTSVLKKINDALININLEIKLEDLTNYKDVIKINLCNEKGERVDFNELSTGQKNIFYLIFSIYGLDLRNGLIIIDEPELHLHTSMQKKYFRILTEIAKPFNLQIILATHSPVFIDESTIRNTFRFSMQNGNSKITQPEIYAISDNPKDLLQILTYTNAARIFFSDIVILVEGDSDEYFFKYFYDNYYLFHRNTKLTVEFLSIDGKANRKRWMEFLGIFGIQNAFIGDFDNVKDIITDSDYDRLFSKAKQSIISRVDRKITAPDSRDGKALLDNLDNWIENDFILDESKKDELRNLWFYILRRNGSSEYLHSYLMNPENAGEFQKIKSKIVEKYVQNIFILQQGDLEAYLGISKSIDNVIGFCLKNFDDWVNSKKSDDVSKIKELMDIMDIIIKGNGTV